MMRVGSEGEIAQSGGTVVTGSVGSVGTCIVRGSITDSGISGDNQRCISGLHSDCSSISLWGRTEKHLQRLDGGIRGLG